MTPEQFQRAMERARHQLVKVGKRAPQRSEAQNMADRFRLHGESYFRFITTPGVEPTNNLAEQAIRFVVIDRMITPKTLYEPASNQIRTQILAPPRLQARLAESLSPA